MREFLTKQRGISEQTLDDFGIQTEEDTAIFPYYSADGSVVLAKKRRVNAGDRRHFYWPPGQDLELYGLWTANSPQFLVEGETDTLRLWQELRNEGSDAGVFGLPGIESWRTEWTPHFDGLGPVYVILDNDEDYNVQTRVNNCWRSIRQALGPKARRIRLPGDVSDVCSFFDRYSLDSLRGLVDRADNGELHFQALDLSIPAEPYDWMVDKWIAKGDITLLVGEPNIGKSWLALDLATKVANSTQEAKWLGHLVCTEGNVLYFDEENPEDVIRHRLDSLGITSKGKQRVRYVLNQGVRLDKIPEKILDEAWAWNPQLIIFDSLTRFHTGDENNAGFINELFGDCIKPLARDTGATVVVLHHTNKSDSSSSFARTRGSSDLGASPDTGLDVDTAGFGRLRVRRYKSRRGRAGDSCYVRIQDGPDGSVSLDVSESML